MKKEEFYEKILNMFREDKGKIIGALVGFLAGILFLLIGFFKTLLIIICTLIGLYLGSRWDIEGDVKKILDKILPPGMH